MRRIFLARHGNRQDFVDPTWPDSAEEPYDPPLSADGIEQARRLGRRLAREGIGAIVTSPFLRTIQTAHHANEALGVPIWVEPGFGEWLEAESFTRMPRLQPLTGMRTQYPALRDGYVPTVVLRYPESATELRERTQRALRALLEKFAGTLLVVGHAASVAAMGLIDTDVGSIECPLCALFCLEYDGVRWRLSLNADTEHVGDRLAPFTFP
jgi:broad specificity phosphatase PhoE